MRARMPICSIPTAARGRRLRGNPTPTSTGSGSPLTDLRGVTWAAGLERGRPLDLRLDQLPGELAGAAEPVKWIVSTNAFASVSRASLPVAPYGVVTKTKAPSTSRTHIRRTHVGSSGQQQVQSLSDRKM